MQSQGSLGAIRAEPLVTNRLLVAHGGSIPHYNLGACMPQNAPCHRSLFCQLVGGASSLDIPLQPMGYTRWARTTLWYLGSFLVAACQVDQRRNNNVG